MHTTAKCVIRKRGKRHSFDSILQNYVRNLFSVVLSMSKVNAMKLRDCYQSGRWQSLNFWWKKRTRAHRLEQTTISFRNSISMRRTTNKVMSEQVIDKTILELCLCANRPPPNNDQLQPRKCTIFHPYQFTRMHQHIDSIDIVGRNSIVSVRISDGLARTPIRIGKVAHASAVLCHRWRDNKHHAQHTLADRQTNSRTFRKSITSRLRHDARVLSARQDTLGCSHTLSHTHTYSIVNDRKTWKMLEHINIWCFVWENIAGKRHICKVHLAIK